ncbi:MAG TPA: NAD-dependent epimerase/dehydratase family protein [Bryobacteraceae bacterium]|jgi:nucleoside-diphosphate-sugar epimerase
MKVFVAGAGGAIGRRLLPELIRAGHQVTGMTRSARNAERIRAAGATPAVADALDKDAVKRAVLQAAPEAVIHELTALPANMDLRRLETEVAQTNRLRTEGLDNLIAAAGETGCRRFIAQSFLLWLHAREGGPIKTEQDPVDPNPPAAFRGAAEALRYLERTVIGLQGMTGIALRYGAFYGPGTAFGAGGAMLEQVRKRRVPVIDGGTGTWSFIHIDDAARATVKALERGAPGVYNIVDDEPAPVFRMAAGARRCRRRQSAFPNTRMARAPAGRRSRNRRDAGSARRVQRESETGA